MILGTCNNFTAIDIEGAEKALTNLSLNDFPGKNIYYLATAAIRHIRFMLSAYALPTKLVMKIILKVCKTSGDILDQNILNYYANTNEMKTRYYLKYPRVIENENSHDKYSPVRVCEYIQVDYGIIFKNCRWPALTDIPVPEGNT